MNKIPIYVYTDNSEKEERLGMEIDRKMRLMELEFTYIDCLWIDDEIDEDTGTVDIKFYINGTTFITPFTKERIELLRSCLRK